MAIDGVKKSIINSFRNANSNPVPKNRTQNNNANVNNYASSKMSSLRFTGSMLKYRLQNTQANANTNFQAFRAKPNDPYANQSATQIAREQLSNYDNASDKKAAAEETGRLIADIATYDPRKALEVANEFMGDDAVRDKDKDELAQEMVRSLDDSQLAEVAESRNGQILLRKMERNLLEYPVHKDEAADANRIRTALDNNGIFLGSEKGMYPEGNGVRIMDDPNATPEQVADYVKYNSDSGRSEFIEALQVHQGDAEWLKGFYSALGTEMAGQLISDTVSPSRHWIQGTTMGGDPSFALAQADLIRDSLNTLQQSGDLTQDGMNALINATSDSNPYVATEIFGKANSEVREMFVKAAINDGDNGWDAGALHVLNTLPNSQKEQILNGLSDNQLNSFIEGAMASQTEIVSLSDSIRFGANAYSDYIDPPLNKTTFGGVETLLNLTAEQRIPYAPYVSQSPFSQDLQNRIFTAVANGLDNPQAFNNLKDNVEFKDAISRSFIANSEDILKSQAPDGAFSDRNFVSGMTKFFELTLFSENGGKLRGELMDSIILTMGDVGDASKAPPISQSAYENTHNGWSQQDHVEVMGGLMGMVWEAASNQKDSIQADITRRQETTKLFVGMAFSFLPGAGDVIGKLAGEGANFFQKLPDEALSFAWDKGKDLLEDTTQDFLLSQIQGLSGRDALGSIDTLMSKFADTIFATNATLPNGEEGELNLRTAFQSAFSFYKDLIDLP